MKSCNCLILSNFAYRSADDSVNSLLLHPPAPGFTRVLFVDFSCAFNTISLICECLILLEGGSQTFNLTWGSTWYWENMSLTPGLLVLVPPKAVCFFLYSFCTPTNHQSIKLLEFTDETTFIGFISEALFTPGIKGAFHPFQH